MKKRGSTLVSKESLELLLAAAIVFVLVYLFFQIFSPTFNPGEEAAESLIESLKGEVEKEEGNFLIYGDEKLYLVYFGSKRKLPFVQKELSGMSGEERIYPVGVIFEVDKKYENYICVCYEKSETENANVMYESWQDMVGHETKEVSGEFSFRKGSCESCFSLEEDAVYSGEVEKNSDGKIVASSTETGEFVVGSSVPLRIEKKGGKYFFINEN